MSAGQQVRRRDAAATREALLGAAARAFAERGFDRTTVRDIARLAGANQALVFRYFGSKEALFEEVMTRGGREQLATTPPERLMEAALRTLLTRDRSDWRAHALEAFVRSIGSDDAAAAIRGELSDGYVRALATLTDADDAELRAHLVLAWLLGIGLVRSLTGRGPVADADPDEICALVLRATRALLERTG
jgi:AcrR family transcriptional regulator